MSIYQTKKGVFTILLALLVTPIVGCNLEAELSNGAVESSQALLDVNDPNLIPPRVDLQLFKVEASGTKTLQFDSLQKGSSGFYLRDQGVYVLNVQVAVDGSAVSFDLDGKDKGVLQIGDNTIDLSTAVKDSDLTIGDHKFTIKATSPQGINFSKLYDLPILCTNSDAVQLALQNSLNSLAVNPISVTPGANVNTFLYSAPGIASPASNYLCGWDYNGDGIREGGYTSCSAQTSGFTNHLGNRRVNVWVKDKTCNVAAKLSKDVFLPVPDLAWLKTNMFIVGDIASTVAGKNFQNDGGENLTHLTMKDPAQTVTCTSSNGGASFTLNGLYHSPFAQEKHDHGIVLNFSGPNRQVFYNDPAVKAFQTASGGTIPDGTSKTWSVTPGGSLTFYSDEDPDISSQSVYSGGCSLSVTVTANTYQGIYCAPKDPNFVPLTTAQNQAWLDKGVTQAQIDTWGTLSGSIAKGRLNYEFIGDFSCNSIYPSNGGGKNTTLKLTNGHFRCTGTGFDDCNYIKMPVAGGGSGGGGDHVVGK